MTVHLFLPRLIGTSLLLFTLLPSRAQSESHKMSKSDVDKLGAEISNWGRWGKEDQLGAANLVTPKKRLEAAKLVKEGVSISMGHEAVTEKAIDNPNPFVHQMHETGANSDSAASDTYSVRYHGLVHTHMDALCHLFYNGTMYNGYPKSLVVENGAKKLGIQNLKNGVFTRGILFDIAALKGVPYLEPGTAIYPEDLEAWEKKAHIKVRPGDAVLIRTGRWARRKEKGPWEMDKLPGLHASCAKWIRDRDLAFIGSDAALDVQPAMVEGIQMPMHMMMLHFLGINILDNFDLEAVSKYGAEKKRYDFLLTIGPFPVEGGTGSPINPIATF
jgi:kynurenine formamidase